MLLSILLSLSLHSSVDSLPPYHTRKQFGEFWWRTWNPRNQTDTIFVIEGNGFWNAGDTIVWHWWTNGSLQPKDSLMHGTIEYGYKDHNQSTKRN